MDQNHTTRFLTILVVLVVIFCGAGLFGWEYYLHQQQLASEAASVANQTTYEKLLAENAAFAKADALYKAGQVTEAEAELNTAFQSAKTPAEEGQIQFKLATVIENDFKNPDQALTAIPLLKTIAADTSYPAIVRASAVQQMGAAFYDLGGDSRFTKEIFKDEPYKSLYVKNYTNLSYRKLFEYAAALYPLAYSELKIANWYANQISLSVPPVKGVAKVTLSSEQITAYKETIRQNIAAADQDIARIKDDPNQNAPVPLLLEEEGVVVGKMQILGDASFGDPEKFYAQALTLFDAAQPAGSDGFVRFNYALYLAQRFGSSRAGDIVNLLAPFYTTSVYKGSSAQNQFISERNNILGSKPAFVTLASIDPNFKSFLISLGWKETDFK